MAPDPVARTPHWHNRPGGDDLRPFTVGDLVEVTDLRGIVVRKRVCPTEFTVTGYPDRGVRLINPDTYEQALVSGVAPLGRFWPTARITLVTPAAEVPRYERKIGRPRAR